MGEITLDKKLVKEIQDYCTANEIEKVDELISKMLKQGFTIEKFGLEPKSNKPKKKEDKVIKTNKYQITIEEDGGIVEEVKIIEELPKPIIKNNKLNKDIYGE